MNSKLSRWWYWNGDSVIAIVVFIVGCAAVIFLLFLLDKQICKAKSEALGFVGTHSFTAGCIVQTESGAVPLNSIRYEVK